MNTLTTDRIKLLERLQSIIKHKETPDKTIIFGFDDVHTHSQILIGIGFILNDKEYKDEARNRLNHLRKLYYKDLHQIYNLQESIDNSQNPVGEIPLPNKYGHMRTSGKPIKFRGPLTLGATSGIHPVPNNSVHVDYKSMIIRKQKIDQKLLLEKSNNDLELLKIKYGNE